MKEMKEPLLDFWTKTDFFTRNHLKRCTPFQLKRTRSVSISVGTLRSMRLRSLVFLSSSAKMSFAIATDTQPLLVNKLKSLSSRNREL